MFFFIDLLQTFDVTKELERLQSPQFRALGPPRHRRQVISLYHIYVAFGIDMHKVFNGCTVQY